MSETYTIVLDPKSGLQYKINEEVVLKEEENNIKEIDSEIDIYDCNKEESTDDERNAKPMYIWKYEQVVELIRAMNSHYDDLNNPRKRKQVFETVANDLTEKNIQVTGPMIQTKWHGLVKSYRKAKETLTKTGRWPTRFNFFDMMDKMFGSNPPQPRSRPSKPIEEVDIVVSMEESSKSEFAEEREKLPPKKYQQKLKREYMQWRNEELKLKQKRHKDKMKLEEAKLELEKRKIALLEKYLRLK